MDSLPGEDPTLPVDFNSSANICTLLDVAEGGGQDHYSGSSGFDSCADDRLSLNKVRTMKDFEKNIELKVEVESLKHDLQEKQNLLVKASKAVESLAGDSGSKIQRLKEDGLKQLQETEDFLNQKIHLLEKEVRNAKAEVEQISSLLNQEQIQRMATEEKLSAIEPQYTKGVVELEDRDRIIEQMNLTLKSKEAFILQLEKQVSATLPCERCMEKKNSNGKDCVFNKDSSNWDLLENENPAGMEVVLNVGSEAFEKSRITMCELQRKLKERDNVTNELQQKLQEKEAELGLQVKNGFKRDKTIQGLTLAIKTKDKENDELLNEIENLKAALAKARESSHKAQLQNVKGVEDYQAILMEKENLLTKQQASTMEKESANRKLLATLKDKDQELKDLQQEREQLAGDLNEAQQQKSQSDRTINDLRNQLEKLHSETLEKENTLQLHYSVILNEHNQRFQSQELAIKHVTAELNQVKEFQESKEKHNIEEKGEQPDATDYKREMGQLKNKLDVTEELVNKLNLAIEEKDLELQQLLNRCKTIQQSKEDLAQKHAYAIKEKDFIITELQQLLKSREMEGEKESEYRQLIRTLKAEQEMYSQLIKSVKDSGSLQKELDTITALRQRLKADIQANQDLRRILEEQIKAARCRENETFSFLGDQTSYLSICLREDIADYNIDHLSVEELRGKVTELLLLIREMQSNTNLKKDSEHASVFHTKDTQTVAYSESALFEKSEVGWNSGEKVALTHQHHTPTRENILLDHSSILRAENSQDMSLMTEEITEAPSQCQGLNVIGENGNVAKPFSTEDEHESRLKPLPVNQRENFHDTEKSFIDLNDMNVEHLRNIVVQLRRELQDLKRNTALAAAQKVELPYSVDDTSSLLNICKHQAFEFGKDNAEDMEIMQDCKKMDSDSKTAQITLESGKSDQIEMQRITPGKNTFKKSRKKSRIPVPLCSSSRTKHDVVTPISSAAQDFITLQKELEIAKIQNQKFTEKLHSAEIEIEKLKTNDVLRKDMRTLSQLDNSNKQERDPDEQLFAEDNMCSNLSSLKEMHEENVNVKQEMCYNDHHAMDAQDEINNDLGGIGARLDNYYAECANETEEQLLQTHVSQMEHEFQREQEGADQTCRTESKCKDTSLSSYDLLVQSQARELSSQREQMKESHSLCVVCSKNLTNMVKAFEELLLASDVDYYVAEGFREQLNQSITLIKKLEYKLGHGELSSDAEVNVGDFIQRYDTDIHNRGRYDQQPFGNKSAVPPARRLQSEAEISEIIYVGSPYLNQETVTRDPDNLTTLPQELPQNLLIEHLEEIRKLRQRLEESIKTNDMLRKQLERQITETEQGSAYNVYKVEQHSELTSDMYHLRKQNEAFQFLLAKESRDKENEGLRETLSKKNILIEHLTRECDCVKTDNEKLQKILCEKENEIGHLNQELGSNRKQLARQQSELTLQQHQLSEHDQLLRSLRIELKVYEHLNEKVKRKTGIKATQPDAEKNTAGQRSKDKLNSLDLSELLAEIQRLRVQLERSIKVSHALHQKLKDQLSREPQENISVKCYLKGNSTQHIERYRTFQDEEDVYSDNSADSSSSTPSRLVPGHRMWADKRGRHVLGLVEDYSALRKQIVEGRSILSDLVANLEHGVKTSSFKIPDDFGNLFYEKVNRTQQSLEEANRLMKLLWRVSLPVHIQGSYRINQDEEMKMEIARLGKKLFEQEKKFSGTMKRLCSENQMKENIERVILEQLALTHEVLKKARGNLEMQPYENHQ
ncbi:CDK5 regulatory subunit-associated protein 2 isoform X2 [Ascaphus truei]|uniref:CDK5 regulatory subunit-associated protein 2 isoform X2 n=1 Tax=Ascaphus truei TaxID=8439 RepID=UPI003F5A78AF